MSSLRIFGIIVGILGILLSFRMFRGKSWNRYGFLASMVFSVGLLVISLNPAVINIIPEMLNLEDVQRGRLIALLICSNIALWFVIIYLRTSLFAQQLQFDDLVRAIGAEKIQKELESNLSHSKIAVLIPALNASGSASATAAGPSPALRGPRPGSRTIHAACGRTDRRCARRTRRHARSSRAQLLCPSRCPVRFAGI